MRHLREEKVWLWLTNLCYVDAALKEISKNKLEEAAFLKTVISLFSLQCTRHMELLVTRVFHICQQKHL